MANDRVQLFEDQPIRTAWVEDEEEWYFSIVDVVQALTESADGRKYWNKLKQRLKEEGSQLLRRKKNMRKTVIVRILVPALCMGLALAGCGSKNSDGNKGSECAYTCTGTGFAFDLPESIKITNGYLFIKDMGDVDYDSGVMMGWPTYYDMTEEEYYGSNSETLGSLLHAGTSFNVMCVEGVNSEEEAKNKMLATLEKMYGKVSDEDRQSVVNYKMLHQENGYVWLWKMDDRSTGLRDESTEEYNDRKP